MTTRLTSIVLCALALLTPLIYVPGIFDFTLHPRLMLIQFGALIGLSAMVLCKTPRQQTAAIAQPLVFWTVWTVLSCCWAINPVEALVQANRTVTFFLLAYVLLPACNTQTMARVYTCAGIAAGAVSIIGIGQYFGWGFSGIPTVGNPSATFGYRNFAASYLIVCLPFAGVFALTASRRAVQAGWALVVILMAIFLIYTRTRGAWIGLGGAVCLAVGTHLYLSRRPHGSPIVLSKQKMSMAALCAILIFAGALLPADMAHPGKFGFDERKSNAATTLVKAFSPGDARGRLIIWRHTLEMVRDHPLWGVGLGSWQFAYTQYDRGDWITSNAAPQRPHNDLLWILSETGIIGLGLYLWLLGAVFYQVWRWCKTHPEHRETALAFGIAVGLLALVGHSCFSFPRERMAPSLMFWLGIGAIARLTASNERAAPWPRPALALTLPLLLCGLTLSYRHMRFDAHYLNAYGAWREQNWPRLQTEAEAARRWGPFNYRVMLLEGLARQKQGDDLGAVEAYRTAQRYHPNEGHDALASAYANLGQWEQALAHYRAEQRLYPHAFTVWMSVADAQEHLGQIDDALQTCRKAAEIWPQSAPLYMRLGRLYQQQEDLPKALTAYDRAKQIAPEDPVVRNNLGAVLTRLQRYADAENAYREALRLQPDYARAYHNLGDLYVLRGDTARAIQAYRGFVKTWRGDPRFTDLVRQRINQLEGALPK